MLSSIKSSLKEIGPTVNSVDIFYSVSEKSEGTVRIYDEEGNAVRTFYDSFTHAAGYYKITWDLKNAKGERVPEGDYVVEFIFDDGIKTVEADLDLEVVGDFALTYVYMTPDRVNVSCDESVKLNYCITEGSTGTIQIYNSEGQIVHTFYNSFYHSAGYYASVWNLKDKNGNQVPLGQYEVRMEFSKPDGSKIDKSVTFELVDELALTSIKATPSQAAKGENIRVYYLTTKDSYGTVRVYDENGKVIRSWYTNTYHAAGYYSITWDQKDANGRQVDAGNYTFELSFNDESTSIVKTVSVQVLSETIIDRKISEISGYTWVPYQYGGTSILGWDCSGFTQWALNYLGVSIPRTTYEQAVAGTAISISNKSLWKPGDILCYSSGGSVDHVALYLGDGMLMHALNTKYGTLIQSVDYYEIWDSSNYLVGVRRYL